MLQQQITKIPVACKEQRVIFCSSYMSLMELPLSQMLPVAGVESKILLEGLALATKCFMLEVALSLQLLSPWPELVTWPPLTIWRPGSAILPCAWKAEGKHFWQTTFMTSTVSVVIMLLP